ncbi:MAG: hypothetical protein K2N27_11345, partial [Ruminococcus sp.]|nr:hypothetical protein [Ruminococcus sp.]
LFELNGKKRKNGIGRFSHNASDLLKSESIVASGNNLFQDEIIKLTEKFNTFGKCYVIAYNEELDKKVLTFREALELVLGNGMPAVIISNKIAVIETEQCYSTPIRYIVKF